MQEREWVVWEIRPSPGFGVFRRRIATDWRRSCFKMGLSMNPKRRSSRFSGRGRGENRWRDLPTSARPKYRFDWLVKQFCGGESQRKTRS
jgi:hypothetical protein